MAHIYNKKSFKMTGLYITYHLGSLFEQPGEYGTSHLMEHLLCKTFKDEYPLLTKLDINWNAYTSHERIVVHFTGLDKYFTPEIKERLVRKLIGGIKIDENEFNTEKDVVLQEYDNSFNDPTTPQNILRIKYNDYGPIGKRSDIENFTFENMNEKYEKFLKTPNQIIEVGPSKSDFSFVTFHEDYIVEPRKTKWKQEYKNVELEEIPENNNCCVEYLSKIKVKKSDFPALCIALDILMGGLESPMYNEIREKSGLAYSISGGVLKMLNDVFYCFSAETTPQNKDKIIEKYNMFFDDISKWITKNRFDDVISSYYINDEKAKLFAYNNVGDIINKGLPIMGNAYKKISFEQVIDAAKKYIIKDNLDLIIH